MQLNLRVLECARHRQKHGLKKNKNKKIVKRNSIGIFSFKTSYGVIMANIFLCILYACTIYLSFNSILNLKFSTEFKPYCPLPGNIAFLPWWLSHIQYSKWALQTSKWQAVKQIYLVGISLDTFLTANFILI